MILTRTNLFPSSSVPLFVSDSASSLELGHSITGSSSVNCDDGSNSALSSPSLLVSSSPSSLSSERLRYSGFTFPACPSLLSVDFSPHVPKKLAKHYRER